MNTRQVVRRLESFAQGRPLPDGSTRHFPIAEGKDALLVAFVRMGGESRPWGIAHAHRGGRPTVLTVPEPRNRTLGAEMASRFAPVLLRHIGHPRHGVVASPGHFPLRQVWLPNPTHAVMLHHLAFAYAGTRFGEADLRTLLNELGRATGWLFRESQRPGQVVVMEATAALRESYAFPADDVRQQHLGFLLEWLSTAGSRKERIRAAAEAERVSVATTLDPRIERDELQAPLEEWNAARKDGDGKRPKRTEDAIRTVLERELLRRLQLTERAIEVLTSDPRPENPGVGILVEASRREWWSQYRRIEDREDDESAGPAFYPSPETDRHAAAAASRYHAFEASESLRWGALVHADEELLADAIAAGNAFRGRILEVQDEGDGRATVPVWRIRADSTGPLRLREDSWVCLVGCPKRTGSVREVTTRPDGSREFEVEITGWKLANRTAGVPHGADPKLKGERVAFVEYKSDYLGQRRSARVWRRGGPGAWLTHPEPPRDHVKEREEGD